MSLALDALLAASAKNRSNYLLGLGRTPDARVQQDPDVTWIDTGVGVLNLAWDANFTPERADWRIREVREHFLGRGLSFSWCVGPLSRPADLGERLLAAGFAHDNDMQHMYLELDKFPGAGELPPGFFVRAAVTPAEVAIWSDVVCRSFGIGLLWRGPITQVINPAGAGDGSPYPRFVGYADGQPVACLALLVADGVAGIYWVGTVPEARGKGYGGALMRCGLEAARRLGASLATLQATELGLPVYRALGFEGIGTESSYRWPRA